MKIAIILVLVTFVYSTFCQTTTTPNKQTTLEPPSSTVQPASTGQPGSTTGQPGSTTGQPGSTTGQPGSTTAAARSSTAAPKTDKTKEKLMTKAKQLEAEAEKEIKALTNAGKTTGAELLKVEADNLKSLIKILEMTSESDHKGLKLVEDVVNKAENRLKDLIKKEHGLN